jgi:hypothetical protein
MVSTTVVLYRVSKGENSRFNLTTTFIAVIGFSFAAYKVKEEKQKQECLQQEIEQEQRSKELLEQCKYCEYFYGQNQVICAVHPSGRRNCSDFLAVKSAE